MKQLIFIITCLMCLNTFAQNGHQVPLKKDCFIAERPAPVLFDTLLYYRPTFDAAPVFDTLFYNETDSSRLIGLGNNMHLLLPLLKKGMLNAGLLKNMGAPAQTYSRFLFDVHGAITRTDKAIDLWEKECVFVMLREEVKSMQKPGTRVFKLEVASSNRSSTSVFYLETTNVYGKLNMPLEEFIDGAYVSCLAKWYVEY